MARTLAADPDSPQSLRIMSAINAALQPNMAAVEQLRRALETHIDRPGPMSDAALEAAKVSWERACGAPMPAEVLVDLRDEVLADRERRRRGPPPVESIVSGVAGRSDIGYDEGLHLHGIRGTWHRLFGLLRLQQQLGMGDAPDAAVHEVRAQFELQLGRAMTADEWAALTQAAQRGASL